MESMEPSGGGGEEAAGMHTGESGHHVKPRYRGLFRKKKKNPILTIVLGWLLRSFVIKVFNVLSLALRHDPFLQGGPRDARDE